MHLGGRLGTTTAPARLTFPVTRIEFLTENLGNDTLSLRVFLKISDAIKTPRFRFPNVAAFHKIHGQVQERGERVAFDTIILKYATTTMTTTTTTTRSS